MTKFFLGVVIGIIISTVGLSGVARIVDDGVVQIKTITKNAVR